MKIGIDISQIVHKGTGVGQYVREMVRALLRLDQNNEYVLFGASFRKLSLINTYFQEIHALHPRVRLVTAAIPPTFLEFIWNTFHIVPVEWFTGPIDVFWSSDWTQPPLRVAKGVTTIHDVSFLRFPETFAKKIIDVQKRRLARVKQECKAILCDSEATKKDIVELMGLPENKLYTVYPGFI